MEIDYSDTIQYATDALFQFVKWSDCPMPETLKVILGNLYVDGFRAGANTAKKDNCPMFDPPNYCMFSDMAVK